MDKEQDPYVTVNFRDTIKTTRPVKNGGNNPIWTHDHKNQLCFDFPVLQPFAPEDLGILEIDVYDQDLLSDAHVGSATVNLNEVFDRWLEESSSLYLTRNKFLEHECTLRRKVEYTTIAGFVQLHIEYFQSESDYSDSDDNVPAQLIVTIVSASDLWDEKDRTNWIPDDGQTGTPMWAALAKCLAYFVVGAFFFVNVEGWTLIDALYFATCTFATVGFGDVSPQTDAGKLFACLYMIVGISLISVALIRVMIACWSTCKNIGKEMVFCLHYCCPNCFKHCCPSHRHSLEHHVEHHNEESSSSNGSSGMDVEYGTAEKQGGQPTAAAVSTKREDNVYVPTLRYLILRMMLSLVIMIGIGTIVYCGFEDLSFVDGIYMSTATVSTIGYGDISPSTQGGRVFAIFWIVLSYVMILQSLRSVVDKNQEVSLAIKRSNVLNRDLSVRMLFL